ncbi:MAG: hypothetical protein MUP90_18575 [Gammaproteobacteria bacterium]|nr:hypothetical protein [Gammaproteobacteria bacterium]
MSTSTLYRLSAVAALLSGTCITVGKLLIVLPNPLTGEVFDFFAPLFGLYAVLGIYLWQRERSGTFGGVAFIVVFFGLALIVSLDYAGAFILPHLTDDTVNQLMDSPPALVYGISALFFLAGEILFGVSVIRSGVISKIAAWLFMIGFVPMTLLGVFPDIIVAIGSVMAGVGIIWWGLSLWAFASN